jgi:hypothetical protein
MTDEIIDEPITYSREEDETETEDEEVADNLALPGHPLYPAEDIASDSIPPEGETDAG